MGRLAYLLLLLWLPAGRVVAPLPVKVMPAQPPLVSARLRALLAAPPGAPAWLDAPATRDFYRRRAYAPAWTAGPQPTAPACAALALLARAADYGLPPRSYHAPALLALADSLPLPAPPARQVARQARFEALLTDGLVQLARHLRRGCLPAAPPSPLEPAGTTLTTFEPARWVAAARQAPDFAAALLRCQPPQREYQQLQRALAQLRRQPASPANAAHARQLALNLERWRQDPIADSDYVLLNLPGHRLEVVRHGRVVHAQRLLIGAVSPTPTFSCVLTGFTLAPEWQATPWEAAHELLPYLQANAEFGEDNNFLADNNYALYDSLGRAVDPATVAWRALSEAHFPYTIRQGAGGSNPLGYITLQVAGSPGVYLYGSSGPPDFGPPYPALATNDVRLERPLALAACLLGAAARRAALPADEAAASALPAPRPVGLRRPWPLHVRYATCAVVGGRVRYYPDVYGRDARLSRQLFGPEPPGLLATGLATRISTGSAVIFYPFKMP